MRFFRDNCSTTSLMVCLATVALLPGAARAAELRSARVTQIINDVKLFGRQAAARPAVMNDNVAVGTAVRTGADSRSELTFADLTITRLGANTIFSFNGEERQIDLGSGAVLVQVPKNGDDAKIRTAAVTAAISGGTALFESHKNFPTKLLMLEGIGRFYRNGHPEDAAIVHGGEMVMMTLDGRITRPTKFNVALLYKTSKLITSFPTLPNAGLIEEVIAEQQTEMASGPSTTTPTDNSIDQRDQATSAALSGPVNNGAKFGSPTMIVNDPYHIISGTAINTDPTITTGGITDFGKLYRGLAIDGPLSTWLGFSPIPFDSFNGLNPGDDFNNPDVVPIAGFLFNTLSLEGDPTISNAHGYPTLGLFARNDIVTTPSGATFTFGGMKHVGLVSMNGSITLSGVSFANFGELFVYARGANLTMEAPVSNVDKVTLRAVDTVELHSPMNVNQFKALAGNTFETSSATTANQIKIESLGSINIANTSQLLGLLNAMGASGQVVIGASGNNGVANIGGTIEAQNGEVDIRQTGTAGVTTLDTATIHGDVVKISALGANGVLNIGSNNVIDANTILKLYAIGSNGTLNFLSNVTLSSPTNILAANTITIASGVTVTINSVNKAQVFTNNPNYNFIPGPGYSGPPPNASNGSFSGAGALDPQPLANAPPLGGPGQGP